MRNKLSQWEVWRSQRWIERHCSSDVVCLSRLEHSSSRSPWRCTGPSSLWWVGGSIGCPAPRRRSSGSGRSFWSWSMAKQYNYVIVWKMNGKSHFLQASNKYLVTCNLCIFTAHGIISLGIWIFMNIGLITVLLFLLLLIEGISQKIELML